MLFLQTSRGGGNEGGRGCVVVKRVLCGFYRRAGAGVNDDGRWCYGGEASCYGV